MQWLKPSTAFVRFIRVHRAGGSKSQVQVGIYCTKVSIDTLVLIARNTDTKVP